MLEDDLTAIALLSRELARLEERFPDQNRIISLTVISEPKLVETYVNPDNQTRYDVILLDHDSKAGGTFYVLDFSKFNLDRIVSISSTPAWMDEARRIGISKIVWKELTNLEEFARNVGEAVSRLIG